MTVIQIEELWKEYRLGVIGYGTLTHDLESWWAKVRGKEDPNAKISPMMAGQEKQIEGDHFWALRDINIDVKQGEVVGIIGGNGAGKSTLLKILSRVTAPTRGNFKVKGRIASLLEVGTGFHPELTGRENIFMNGAILGMSKFDIKTKLDDIIDFSGVESFIDTPVKRYSSGMYVRLAFAVAAHLDPEILIVDEVLAVGDASFQKKCIGKLKDVSGEGRTVLFVSHNMAAINTLCSKGFLFENGRVLEEGDVSKIVKIYNENAAISLATDKLGQSSSGTGEATVANIIMLDDQGRQTTAVEVGSSVTLQVVVALHASVPDLVLGYMIKDHFGQSIFGTNTNHMNTVLQDLKSGESITYSFNFTADLGPGSYSVTIALHSSNGYDRSRYEWKELALTFNVVNLNSAKFEGKAWLPSYVVIER